MRKQERSRGRLPLAAVLSVLALACAGLLWMLGSGGARGTTPALATGDAAAADPEAALGAAALDDAAAPDGAPRPPASERTELASASAEPEADSAAFDPAAITGRVTRAGRPVEGVELFLFAGEPERRERIGPAATAESDADGRFRFPGREPFARHTVRAQHPDYLPAEEPFHPGRDGVIELEPAARVAGTVRSARTLQPLADVEVALERWHYGADGMSARVRAVTDTEGRWQLPWAEPGIERFLVKRPGHAPERHEFQVGPEGGAEFEILVGDLPGLELEVYAHETGELLADAELEWDDAEVRTDARGRLTVPVLRGARLDEPLRVSLARPGGCTTQGRVSVDAVRGFLRVPVCLGSAVHGRVLDADGAPVAGALVRMAGGRSAGALEGLPEGFWVVPSRSSARSGADGTFRLAGLPPRTEPADIRANHPQHPPGRSAPFDLPRSGLDLEVDVVLARGGTIEGTLSLDGEPAPLELFWEGESGGGWVRSNDRGAYRITGVAAGEVDLRPRTEEEDEDVERAEDARVTLAEGETLVLDFDLAAPTARIRGHVLDARGAPVAEAEVVALPAAEGEEWEDEEPRTETEADGSFELNVPDVPGMLFDVRAERGPRSAVAEDVRAGAEVELTLPVLAPLALRVVDALEREPVLGFQVYWRESESGSFARLVQGGGRFSPGPDGLFVAELPLGELDLAVSARQQGLVTAFRPEISVDEGGARVVEVELERGVELEVVFRVAPEAVDFQRHLRRGRVSIASEAQWSDRARGGALYQQDVRSGQSLRVGEGDVARLNALAPGTYRLLNVPREFRVRPEQFEVPPVAQHRVELTVEPQDQGAKPGDARD